MFTAALLIIAKSWKQPRCPSLGEWVNKLVFLKSGLLFSTKMKQITKPFKKMETHLIHITSRERKPIWEGYILCDSNDNVEV